MHFVVGKLLSITIITETYVCQVQNLRPMNWLIYYTTANTLKLWHCAHNTMCANARPHSCLIPFFQRAHANICINLILPETIIESLSYMFAIDIAVLFLYIFMKLFKKSTQKVLDLQVQK